MNEFPGNSARSRERPEGPPEAERPKVERVTSGTARRRKRGVGRQFKNTFVNGTARGALEYMIGDVVVPAIQDTLIDAFQGGIERLIRGESRRRGIRPSSSYSTVPQPHVNYQGITVNRPPSTASGGRMLSRQSRSKMTFDEIVIPSHAEADDVLTRMYEYLSRSGVVLVSELYEMTGIASTHTDHKWGWTSLRGAKIMRLRTGGYLLDLPEPEPLS